MALTNEGPSMSTPAFANGSRMEMPVSARTAARRAGQISCVFRCTHAFRYRNAAQKNLSLLLTTPILRRLNGFKWLLLNPVWVRAPCGKSAASVELAQARFCQATSFRPADDPPLLPYPFPRPQPSMTVSAYDKETY